MPITSPTRATIEQSARSHLGSTSDKHLSIIGGVIENGAFRTDGNTCYIKLPVVTFCSPNRHETGRQKGQRQILPSFPMQQADRPFVLDLHTSEMSIEVTASNAGLSLKELSLEDCVVSGALNIYAVKRYRTEDGCVEDMPRGKDAIFRQSKAWEHPLGSSERGLACLLSTLRVFASLTTDMETPEQDAVLHVFYLLTQFPPAIRAMHVLIAGKSPSNAERAALGQSIYEVLKSVIPLQIIKSDSTRLFEGSRLLFGLILEKAKHLKVCMDQQETSLAYIDAMRTQELRNPLTMEPVAVPVQTLLGLVDQGLYEAFKEDGGVLKWTNGTHIDPVTSFDRKLHRAALLSGGKRPQIVSFDIDAVSTSKRYADQGKIDRVISSTEYSDLQYLATLCSRNKLAVVHPSTLPSATPPTLTLDRNGLLAVFVGRQGCAVAGRDIGMFRPTSRETESVDVSIITQLLVSILDRRNADGTAIFEAFSDHQRQIRDPDEVLMFVLDCSASMNDRCGFVDVQENEEAVEVNPRSRSLDEELAEEGPSREFEWSEVDDLKGKSFPRAYEGWRLHLLERSLY